MSENNALDAGARFVWSVWQRPIVQISLAVFTTATAYLVGTINRIGLGFAHLLDKTDLFVVAATCGSIAAVLFSIFARIWRLGEIDETFRPARIFAFLALGFVSLLAIVRFTRFDLLISSFVFWVLTVTTIAVGVLWFTLWRLKALNAQRRAVVLGVVQVLAIAASYLLAGLLVDYARKAGDRLTITMSGGETLKATIAAKATDGLLVFIEGSDDTTYLPLAEISRIDGELLFPNY